MMSGLSIKSDIGEVCNVAPTLWTMSQVVRIYKHRPPPQKMDQK